MENIDFKKIVDNLFQAVIVADKKGQILYANDYFCELFTTNCNKLKEKNISDFISDNKIEIKNEIYETKTIDYDEYSVIICHPAQTQMEKIYSDFISTVSHELRTPLTSIRGFADTMLFSYDKLDESQIKKFLQIIKDQSNRLIKLIENLLSISRMQTQNEMLVYKAVNVKSQIEQALLIVKNQYKTHHFLFQCEDGIMPALVDENKFQQIMINVLDNAAKYSESNTTVEITAKNHDNNIKITVNDHGTGITKENLCKIFDKFARIENHLTSKTQGSGLGLYIVKNLVEKMNGSIKAESSTKPDDHGTSFIITLPAASYTNQCSKKLRGDR